MRRVTLESLGIETLDLGCQLCSGHDFTVLATQDRHLLGIRTAGCNRCGLIQTYPRPSPESLSRFYSHHYHTFYQGTVTPSQAYVALQGKSERLRATAEFLVDRIGLTDSSSILDFGCGEGTLFGALRACGFSGQLYGLEQDASFAEYAARETGACIISELPEASSFDLIVMNHSLEHIGNPTDALRNLSARLSPGGRLYIDVPDVDGYGSLKDLHIAHLTHYSTRTLRRLLEQSGFAIDHLEQYTPAHHPASIRLIARVAAGERESSKTDRITERPSWDLVRKLATRAWLWIPLLHLYRMKLPRAVYRKIKTLGR